jgi:hypothetical protein
MRKPPDNPIDAKKWAKAAMEAGRYEVASVHFPERLEQRGETMRSVKTAIARAERVEPYPAMPEHGGTCWRVIGVGTNGKRLGIGVELYLDDNDEWAVLCTVLDLGEATKGRRR